MVRFTFRVFIIFRLLVVLSVCEIIDLRNTKCTLKCKTPQPRVIKLQELELVDKSKDTLLNNSITCPEVMVIHRCEQDSGCCKDPTYTCQPYLTTNITIKFSLQVVIGVRTVYEDSQLEIVNHTECSCQRNMKDKNRTHCTIRMP